MSDTNDDDWFNADFYCPIGMNLMEDPVIDPDGNTFERNAIEKWLRKKGTSPITRNRMDISQLRSNRMVKDLIDKAKKRRTVTNFLSKLGLPSELTSLFPDDFFLSALAMIRDKESDEAKIERRRQKNQTERK